MVQLLVSPLEGGTYQLNIRRGASAEGLTARVAARPDMCRLLFRGKFLLGALPDDAERDEALRVVARASLRGGGQCCSRPALASKDIVKEVAFTDLAHEEGTPSIEVAPTEDRAISVQQLQDVRSAIEARCEAEGWCSTNPAHNKRRLKPPEVHCAPPSLI